VHVEADFHDLAMAYFERVAAQGLVYVEVFFDPQAHTSREIGFDTVITGLRRAQQDAAERFGIRSQLIMCFLRDNPPVRFREVFAAAREQGYRLTMHCDVDQQDSTTTSASASTTSASSASITA